MLKYYLCHEPSPISQEVLLLLLPQPIINTYIIALHKSALHYRWWCVLLSPTWVYIPCLPLKNVFHLKWFLLMSIIAKCNSHGPVLIIVNFFLATDAFEHLFFLKLSNWLVCYCSLLNFILWFLFQLTFKQWCPLGFYSSSFLTENLSRQHFCGQQFLPPLYW